MNVLRKFMGVVRAPFLLLVPACLAPAYAVVYAAQGAVAPVPAMLVFIAALAAHMGVNALNEFEDFRSGLDFTTRKTPFSGGSGTLVAEPGFAPAALFTGWFCVLLTLSIGVYFYLRVGAGIIMPGLLGLLFVVTYTRWINKFPLLCLATPGIGFGLLFVNLTVVALTGHPSTAGFVVSLPVALLVSNLLLVNQLPDIEADCSAGRNHIAIAYGSEWAKRCSAILIALAYLSILAGWLAGVLPSTAMLAWLTLPIAVSVVRDLFRNRGLDAGALVPAMGRNVLVTLLTPLLLAAGIILGAG